MTWARRSTTSAFSALLRAASSASSSRVMKASLSHPAVEGYSALTAQPHSAGSLAGELQGLQHLLGSRVCQIGR